MSADMERMMKAHAVAKQHPQVGLLQFTVQSFDVSDYYFAPCCAEQAAQHAPVWNKTDDTHFSCPLQVQKVWPSLKKRHSFL